MKPAASTRGGTRWYCQCDCGAERSVLSGKLLKGITLSCGCVRDERLAARRWTGYGELSGSHWASIVRGARHRNKEMSITIEDAWNLYLKQGRMCALSRRLITMKVGKTRIGTASLDRIDSTAGYTLDNVQWLHKDVNKMKMEFSVEYFIKLCEDITSLHRV
jgi:hypothetical protein